MTPQALGQAGPGWVTLLDGTNIGDWNRVGFTLQHGGGVIKFRKVAVKPL